MLNMVLPKCRKLGSDEVLVTCNCENEGSKRIILKKWRYNSRGEQE